MAVVRGFRGLGRTGDCSVEVDDMGEGPGEDSLRDTFGVLGLDWSEALGGFLRVARDWALTGLLL